MSTPLFFHQLKSRDPNAFALAKRTPLQHRNDPSACIDLSGIAVEEEDTDISLAGQAHNKPSSNAKSSKSKNTPSYAMSLRHWNYHIEPLQLIVHEDADQLREFASKLFSSVDSAWAGAWNRRLFWHEIYIFLNDFRGLLYVLIVALSLLVWFILHSYFGHRSSIFAEFCEGSPSQLKVNITPSNSVSNFLAQISSPFPSPVRLASDTEEESLFV